MGRPQGASTATPGRRAQGLAERRRRLIRAAAELIAERDHGAFTMPELAARAGLSLATPYNLIGSKAAVISQLIDRQVRGFHAEQGWMAGLSPAARALELVDRLVAALARQERFLRNLWKALYALGSSEHGKFPMLDTGHLMSPLVAGLARDGLLPAKVPAKVLDATLQRIFNATMEAWAAQDWPMDHLRHELRASFALVFLGLGSDADAALLAGALAGG